MRSRAILPSVTATAEQSLFEVHRHKGHGEDSCSTQRRYLIREQPEIEPWQPATIFTAAGDALGIDRQLPGSLTLPATPQAVPQLKCALLSGARYSREKLPSKHSEHPGEGGEAEQCTVGNGYPQENWGASHFGVGAGGWGLHPRLSTPGRGTHPTPEAKVDGKGWAQLLLQNFYRIPLGKGFSVRFQPEL